MTGRLFMQSNLESNRFSSSQPEPARVGRYRLRADRIVPIQKNRAHNRNGRIFLMPKEKQQLGTTVEVRTSPAVIRVRLHDPASSKQDRLEK